MAGTSDHSVTASRRGQAGFTLLESAIAMVLTAILLQVVVSSTLVINQSTHLGNKRVTLLTKADSGIRRLYYELLRSSLNPDPETGLPRLAIEGVDGNRTVTFQRVVDFAAQSGEVVPVWSTPIVYEMVGGNIQRRQDGNTTIVLRNTTTLDFMIEVNRVRLRLGIQAEDDKTAGLNVVREMVVSPAF